MEPDLNSASSKFDVKTDSENKFAEIPVHLMKEYKSKYSG